MSKRLEGKIAVITGGAQGIGRVTAILFAGEGAKLVLLDKDATKVKAVADEINAGGGSASAVACDISKQPEIAAAINDANAKHGALHILVNNAGVTLTRPFISTTDADIDFLVGVNLKGTIFASQAAIPHLIESGGGAIVHDASNAGIVGRPWQPVYGATKAGIVSLTKSMALAHANIDTCDEVDRLQYPKRYLYGC